MKKNPEFQGFVIGKCCRRSVFFYLSSVVRNGLRVPSHRAPWDSGCLLTPWNDPYGNEIGTYYLMCIVFAGVVYLCYSHKVDRSNSFAQIYFFQIEIVWRIPPSACNTNELSSCSLWFPLPDTRKHSALTIYNRRDEPISSYFCCVGSISYVARREIAGDDLPIIWWFVGKINTAHHIIHQHISSKKKNRHQLNYVYHAKSTKKK